LKTETDAKNRDERPHTPYGPSGKTSRLPTVVGATEQNVCAWVLTSFWGW